MSRSNRAWSILTKVAVIDSSVAVALAACALIVAFAIRPPALGWVGFAIVSIGVLGLAALLPLAFERTRVSARPPAGAGDQEQRLLVIADSHCSETALSDEIVARLADAVAVLLATPPEGDSVLARARLAGEGTSATSVTVSQVIVPATPLGFRPGPHRLSAAVTSGRSPCPHRLERSPGRERCLIPRDRPLQR